MYQLTNMINSNRHELMRFPDLLSAEKTAIGLMSALNFLWRKVGDTDELKPNLEYVEYNDLIGEINRVYIRISYSSSPSTCRFCEEIATMETREGLFCHNHWLDKKGHNQ